MGLFGGGGSGLFQGGVGGAEHQVELYLKDNHI
jgi:hypothetical protein